MHGLLVMVVLTMSTFGPGGADVALVSSDELVRAPVTEEAYSWDLRELGYKNGRMPSIRMIEVGSCLLERDAAYTLSQMIEDAALDGVTLDPAWCYRSLEQQRSTYDANCPVVEISEPAKNPLTGEALLDEQNQPIIVDRGTERVCSLPTASPSRSNHGWGRAVDFEIRGRTLGCGDRSFRWLQENASDYGWTHPDWAWCNRVTREPWHWEYGGLQLLPFPSLLEPVSVTPPSNVE